MTDSSEPRSFTTAAQLQRLPGRSATAGDDPTDGNVRRREGEHDTSRRGTGEGTVYQHALTGLWYASVELGRDPRTGRRRRKVVAAKTKGETLRRLADLRRTVDAGLPVMDARRSTADYTVVARRSASRNGEGPNRRELPVHRRQVRDATHRHRSGCEARTRPCAPLSANSRRPASRLGRSDTHARRRDHGCGTRSSTAS